MVDLLGRTLKKTNLTSPGAINGNIFIYLQLIFIFVYVSVSVWAQASLFLWLSPGVESGAIMGLDRSVRAVASCS